MLAKQKCPVPRGQRGGPGDDRTHTGSYPIGELQGNGESFAAAWIDAVERFASALWNALAFDQARTIAAIIRKAIDADLRLDASDFPTPQHWNIVAILCGCAERRIRPTPAAIIGAARSAKLELPTGGGDPKAEVQVLLWRESSAALLLHHGRELQRFSRRASRVRRLWRVLSNTIDVTTERRDSGVTPIIVRRSARRLSA